MLKGLYTGDHSTLMDKWKNNNYKSIINNNTPTNDTDVNNNDTVKNKFNTNTTRELSTRIRKIPDKLTLNTQKVVPLIVPYAGQPIPAIPRNLSEALADNNPHRYSWLKASNKEMRELVDREVIKGDTNDDINAKNYLEKCKIDKPFKSKTVFRANHELDEMM